MGEDANIQRFVVCPRTLSRTSKVFKAMLYGNFVESKPSNKEQEWVVALPEDDPTSLATVLYIIHNKFSLVPDKMTREELYHITILTDKYDMTEVLRPWARAWIEPFDPVSRAVGQKGDEQLLWIAWELGHINLFKKTLGNIQETCTLDEDGKVLDRHGIRLEDNTHIQSLGVLGLWWPIHSLSDALLTHEDVDGKDGLNARRIDFIKSLLSCVQSKVDYLARDSSLSSPSSRFLPCGQVGSLGQATLWESCKTWFLGSIIRSLAKAGYYPLPLPGETRCSVLAIRTNLEVVCKGIRTDGFHSACCPSHELRSALAMVAMSEVALTDAQRQHLQQQALKTGLPVMENAPQPTPVALFTGSSTTAASTLFTANVPV